jgi:hypothetical protein
MKAQNGAAAAMTTATTRAAGPSPTPEAVEWSCPGLVDT